MWLRAIQPRELSSVRQIIGNLRGCPLHMKPCQALLAMASYQCGTGMQLDSFQGFRPRLGCFPILLLSRAIDTENVIDIVPFSGCKNSVREGSDSHKWASPAFCK